jgi:hypothetical protein
MVILPAPVLTFCHHQEILRVQKSLEDLREEYLMETKPHYDQQNQDKWLASHYPIYLMDGDKDVFFKELGCIHNIPHVLVWSARGQGLQSSQMDAHMCVDTLNTLFNSPQVSSWPKIILVFQKYGALKTAKQIFEKAKQQTVVVWASMEVESVQVFQHFLQMPKE